MNVFEAVVIGRKRIAPDTILAQRTLPGGAVRTRPLVRTKDRRWIEPAAPTTRRTSLRDGKHDAKDFKITAQLELSTNAESARHQGSVRHIL